MTVVDIKRQAKRPRRVSLDDSGAARFMRRIIRDIQSDLGDRGELSRIEKELVTAFAGAATQLQYLNTQVALGDGSAIDLGGYATLASTMLRIGVRLGFQRRARNCTPTLEEIAEEIAAEKESF
jgi:hypothetical protein